MSTNTPNDPPSASPVRADRQRFVEEALHSGEMEGFNVTPAFNEDAAAYVNGDITFEEFSSRVRTRNINA